MSYRSLLSLTLSFVLIGGCTWVNTTPQGEKVRVLSAAEVGSCRRLGETTVSVADKIGWINRGTDQIRRELAILARNSAVSFNGDTVVPVSEVSGGQQRFAVFRCVGP